MAFGDADASTPAFVKANAAGKNVTTGSFTPPVGALLVAFADHDTAGGNLTNTSVVTDSQGLTWTIRATVSKQSDGAGFANGHLQISTAVVASSVAMTVTTTGTNTNNPAGLYVRVITGADTTTPMDATPVENTSTNSAISVNITTVTDGARVFLGAIDWNLAANMTAGTGQTAVVADGIGAPDMRVYVGVQNAVTSPAGSVTMSTASPTTGNTSNYAAVAIRPASTTTKNADATLTGTATITPAATSTKPVDASLAATATVTPTAASTKPVAAALTATATATATAASTKPVTAALTGTATITAAGASAKPVDASLTATALITAAASVGTAAITIDAAPTFTATITPAAATTKPDAAALTGTASITTAATVDKPILAALTVTAAITATASVTPTVPPITVRPNTGTTAKPSSGITPRPFTGVTVQP